MRRLIIALLCLLVWESAGRAEPGRIVDAVSGAGIAGATVTLGANVVQTDRDGRFEAASGTSPVQARAPG